MKKLLVIVFSLILMLSVTSCQLAESLFNQTKPSNTYLLYVQKVQSQVYESGSNQVSQKVFKTDLENSKFAEECVSFFLDNQEIFSELAEHNGKYTAEQLKNMISMETTEELITTTVIANSSEDAYNIAKMHCELVQKKFLEIFNDGRIEVVRDPIKPR